MDLNDVETIDVKALHGVDSLTVNDLSGTDVTQINVNRVGTIGGTAGDGAADKVIVNATSGADVIDAGAGTSATVVGLGKSRRRTPKARMIRLLSTLSTGTTSSRRPHCRLESSSSRSTPAQAMTSCSAARERMLFWAAMATNIVLGEQWERRRVPRRR
jgi:hypothetical protein